jgi:putative hydrolase of the HAD superfamily
MGLVTRAVLVDALGTLLELEPPWDHLEEVLEDAPGEADLMRAFAAEMAYYRDHASEGRDPDSLLDLRRRCAEVLSRELGVGVDVETMLAAIRFQAYPDAAPALRALRGRGLRLVVVSNWDCSLPEVIDRVGLGGLVDGVVTSASVGASKPDPAIFEAGLAVGGCSADEALHVGDTLEDDVGGARAAGIRALLLDRGGGGDISSLHEIEELV